MKTVAVLGANGFVGTRIVEMFHLGGKVKVRPVVRRFSGLASLARFDVDARVMPRLDVESYTEALQGCDWVINTIAGNPRDIEETPGIIYDAAERAGVRRLVHVSSASVHGQAPTVDVTESSVLSDQQSIEYNNSKVRAEKILQGRRTKGRVELVIFRPSIVFGPRSRWVKTPAEEISSGVVALVEGGKGICNTIYVDNLAHALWLGAETPGADAHVFFVSDNETLSWKEYYAALAGALGANPVFESIPRAAPRSKSALEKLDSIRVTDSAQKMLKHTPAILKRMAKGALKAIPEPVENPWFPPTAGLTTASEEISMLQTSQWRMPIAQAQQMLGYSPLVSFAEGIRRSAAWIKWRE